MNGFTSEEMTGYWCKIPSKNVKIALNVLIDMVKNPAFDEKELEKERKVIFEEIKMHKDSPRLYVMNEIQRSLYSGTLGEDLAGTFDTLNSVTKKSMIEKFKQVYQPANMVFCAVGNYDFNKLANYLEKSFKKRGKRFPLRKFELVNMEKIEVRKGIDQANIVFAFHAPLAKDKNSYACYLLATIMASGMSSRLFSEIREKRNLAYAIKGELNVNRDFSYFYVYIGAKKENVNLIKQLIIDEFKKV